MAKLFKGPVWLEPIEHIYHHRVTKERYTSVTTALGLIEEDFDTDAVATYIANMGTRHHNKVYHPMNKEQIVEYWEAINTEATDYGTSVHELLEEYLMKDKWLFPKGDLERAVLAGYHDLKIDEGIELWPERILFSEEYKLAGTTDVLVDVDETYFDIGDWKTNKVITYYNDFGNKTLLPPFDHLQDCSYNLYSLQLSVYALMYEMETGRKCRHIWIGHFDRKDYSFKKIPIMYMKNEALQLLKHHRYQTELKKSLL